MAALVGRSGVSRATAYRCFPGGVESVFDYVNDEALRSIRRNARRAVHLVGGERCDVRIALTVGVRRVLDAFREDELFRYLQARYPEDVFAYLTTRRQGGLWDHTSEFTAECVMTHPHGNPVEPGAVDHAVRKFVWSVISAVVANWPLAGDPGTSDELLPAAELSRLIDLLVAEVAVGEPTSDVTMDTAAT
jgi:hypothetical protein